MAEKFHKRFGIHLSEEEAQRRFVNRMHNSVWSDFINQGLTNLSRYKITQTIISSLGERNDRYLLVDAFIGNNFFRCLEALEVLYQLLSGRDEPEQLDYLITTAIGQSEIDLGIRWENGHFYPAGSALLDEKAVNDVLGLLDKPALAGAAQAFDNGLNHFLHSTKRPELLSDVVIRMHEALEATAKIICDNDKDLTANSESFVSKVKLPEPYKRLLKEYIKYANDLHRHAAEKGKPKSPPSHREVEAFIYLTGLFIRLALTK